MSFHIQDFLGYFMLHFVLLSRKDYVVVIRIFIFEHFKTIWPNLVLDLKDLIIMT